MHVVVLAHGHCFDGLSSSVVFSHLFEQVAGSATFSYRACGYGEGQLTVSDAILLGDQNAILDYRFSPSERVTWYFDHHRTAFAGPEDRAVFDSRVATGRYFFDAGVTSCAKLVRDVARARFGVDVARFDELVTWADLIDSANFASAEEAMDQTNPVMRLAAVVERHGDDALLTRLVGELSKRSVGEVAESKEVSRMYRKIGEMRERFIRRVQERAKLAGRVVLVDLTDQELESVGKFVTYALYPTARYSVIVGLLKNSVKISVGYNPWSGGPCDVDVSALCARYGGGGHRVVGAIPFKRAELPRAREIAQQIARDLDDPGTA